MKRFTLLALILILSFVLAACGASKGTTVVSEPEAAPAEAIMEEEVMEESDEEMAETKTIGVIHVINTVLLPG